MSINTAHALRKGCYDEKCIQYNDRDKMQEIALKKYQEALMSRSNSVGTSSELVSKYFKQLTKIQIQRLYRVYKLDFEMFGYEYPDEYLNNSHK